MITLDDQKTGVSYLEMYHKQLDEGAYYAWALFPPSMTDDEIETYCNRDLDWDLDGYYSYPGGFFANQGSFRRTKTRTLVTQYCGYDI